MLNKKLLPLNLQLFAEDSGSNGSVGTDTGANVETQETDQNTNENDGSTDNEDDTTKSKTYTRKDVNKIVASAVAEALERADLDGKAKNAVSEAQRLAQMTDEEKAAEAQKQRIADLEAREAKIAAAEMRNETIKQLSEAGLDASFVEMALADDAETVKTNISALKKAFDAAVEKAVNERIKQKPTITGVNSNSDDPFSKITNKYK